MQLFLLQNLVIYVSSVFHWSKQSLFYWSCINALCYTLLDFDFIFTNYFILLVYCYVCLLDALHINFPIFFHFQNMH